MEASKDYLKSMSEYLFTYVFKDCSIPNEAWLDKKHNIMNTKGLGGAFRIMLSAKVYSSIKEMSSDITAKTKIIVPVSFIKQCIEDSKDNPISWEEYHDD